jgi:hypothetical protein
MERRRAIAWAGSITVTGCVSALMLGSLVGAYDLGPSPTVETPVDSLRPKPGTIAPGGLPGGAQAGPVPAGTQPAPAPGSPSVVQAELRSPAGGGRFPASVLISPFGVTADVGDAPEPKVGLVVPCAPPDTTTARTFRTTEVPPDRDAPSYTGATDDRPEPTSAVSLPRKTPTTPSKVDAPQPGGGARWQGRVQQGIPGMASRVDLSGPSVARGKASGSGRSPGGEGKHGAGSRVMDGMGHRGG